MLRLKFSDTETENTVLDIALTKLGLVNKAPPIPVYCIPGIENKNNRELIFYWAHSGTTEVRNLVRKYIGEGLASLF